MKTSASIFGFNFSEDKIRKFLSNEKNSMTSDSRVRLLLSRDGTPSLQHTPLHPLPIPPGEKYWTLWLADKPVVPSIFLAHKTTRRKIYDEFMKQKPSRACDVLLWNNKKEITETCFANIAVKFSEHGEWFTPPLSCGLLNGTMRSQLLEEKKIHERVITLSEIFACAGTIEVMVFNSVRKTFTAVIPS